MRQKKDNITLSKTQINVDLLMWAVILWLVGSVLPRPVQVLVGSIFVIIWNCMSTDSLVRVLFRSLNFWTRKDFLISWANKNAPTWERLRFHKRCHSVLSCRLRCLQLSLFS